MGTQTPLRPLSRLLLDAVRGGDGADVRGALGGTGIRDVLAAGRLHRVTPAVERVVRGWDDAPGDWHAALAVAKHEQLMRHLRALADLRAVGAALDARDIAWVAVKGPVLAGALWPAVNMREYFDVDVVVDRRRFADALAAVEGAGATLLDRNWPELRRTMRAELAMRAASGTPLDLHWHVAVPRELRRSFRLDMDAMLARRRTVDVGGLVLPTFDPVDTVVHLAFHAAQSGANRLMWLADVRFALEAPGVTAVELERRARAAGAELAVAMVVDRVRRVLGLPASYVSSGGEPSRVPTWVRVARRRDARSPFPGLPGDRSLGGNEYPAARRGTVDSAVMLVRHHAAARRSGRRHDAGQDVARPLQIEVPDAAARAAYFAEVVGAAAK